MKYLAAVLLGLVASSEALHYPIHHIADKVNSLQTTWTAGANNRFVGGEYEDVKRLLGTFLPTPSSRKLPAKIHTVLNEAAIPDSFDSRTYAAWAPYNCSSLAEVRDQSNCGSCWAFGAAEAGTDRICIQTKGTVKTHLSTQHLTACCALCGSGCNGGYPSSAWSYMKSTGLVSGGNYGDFSYCSAYSMPICDHHVVGKYQPCSGDSPTPKCPTKCDANSTYSVAFASDHHKFKTSYSIASNVAQIQTEILTNGPVEGAFTVYDDFPSYKSGVYVQTSSTELGGHAIKILGWGTENNTPYWLVANSWNEDWGDNGFFKIRRGTDECGIEDEIVAGLYV